MAPSASRGGGDVGAADPTVTSDTPLAAGTVVGATYEITSVLGRGGMGTVWAARHLRLPGKRVALKVLHVGPKGRGGETYARFRREAEIASRIGHPNIVEVLDFNTLGDGTPYLVLELLAGESLGARLLRGPLPLPAALDVVRQVGSALEAAHRAGVVHRDLKPENVFLCPTEAGGVVHELVKVLDFGISKIQGSETVVTQDAVLIGTPQYMAPEQAAGRNQAIDARTDVFALGVMAYEMLSGRPPFAGNGLAAVVYAVIHQPHVPLAVLVPSVPAAVSAAVDRALAKRPEDRFPTAAAFVEALTGRPLQTLRNSAPAADALAATGAFVPGTAVLAAGSVGSAPGATATGSVGPVAITSAPTASRARGGRAAVIVAITVIVLAAATAAAVWRARGPSPGPATQVERPAADPGAAPAAGRPAAAPAPGRPTPAAPAPTPPVEPVPARPDPAPAASAPPPAPRPSRPEGRERQETLAPSVAAELVEAEAALGRGDTAAAVRLAQHSLYAQKSSRAFSVVARARCRQGDIGSARAALTRVSKSDRPAVLRDCAAVGMDLR